MKTYRLQDTIFPGDDVEIVRYHLTKMNADVHDHDFAEIAWVEEGVGLHIINRETVGIGKGDLLLIRPGDQHCYRPRDAKGFVLLNIAIPMETYEHVLRRYSGEVGDLWGEGRPFPLHVNVRAEDLETLIRYADLLSVKKSQQLAVDRFLLELLGIVGRYYEPQNPEGPSWLMKACEHIRSPRHFAGGVEEFYRLCGKSPGHVARVVMAVWKKTPTDIVNQARLEHAAMRLAMGSDDILDVSMEAGFLSLAHFYKLFNKQYGITPRRYRLSRQSLVIHFDELTSPDTTPPQPGGRSASKGGSVRAGRRTQRHP